MTVYPIEHDVPLGNELGIFADVRPNRFRMGRRFEALGLCPASRRRGLAGQDKGRNDARYQETNNQNVDV